MKFFDRSYQIIWCAIVTQSFVHFKRDKYICCATTLCLSIFRKSDDFSISLEFIKSIQLIDLIEETVHVRREINTWVSLQT